MACESWQRVAKGFNVQLRFRGMGCVKSLLSISQTGSELSGQYVEGSCQQRHQLHNLAARGWDMISALAHRAVLGFSLPDGGEGL